MQFTPPWNCHFKPLRGWREGLLNQKISRSLDSDQSKVTLCSAISYPSFPIVFFILPTPSTHLRLMCESGLLSLVWHGQSSSNLFDKQNVVISNKHEILVSKVKGKCCITEKKSYFKTNILWTQNNIHDSQ